MILYILLSDEHRYLITLPTMRQSCDIRLDRLYCGKWRKNSNWPCDLDLDWTISNVKLARAISIY